MDNNDLKNMGAISLDNVNNEPTNNSTVNEVEQNNDVNNEQVVQEENNNAVLQPIPGTTEVKVEQVNINGFAEPNKKETVGVMPPSAPKGESKAKKFGFVILIIILIIAVAFGVYSLLKFAKTRAKVDIKENLILSIGSPVSTNINDYANIGGTDPSNCTLDASKIDNKKFGKYEFIITCQKKEYKGNILVKDTTAPVVSLKTIYRDLSNTNDMVVDDFLTSCTDASGCEVNAVNEDKFKQSLTEVGYHSIDLNVKDKENNIVKVNANMYVLPDEFIAYLSAESEEVGLKNYKATKTITDILTIGNYEEEIKFMGYASRVYKYKFENKDEYRKALGINKNLTEFDGIKGTMNYDDKNNILTITNNLPIETLNKEVNGEFPISYDEVKDYYSTIKNYTLNTIRK